MNNRNLKIKWKLIFVVMFALALFLDQWTKQLAITRLQGQNAYLLWEGVLEFRFYANTGIAWSMLEGQMALILFTGMIFLLVVLFCIFKLPVEKKFRIVYVLGGLLAGGALGNMIDRIRLGYVVDFIYVSLIDFPIFNVADMFIVCDVILLGVLFTFVYKEEDLAFLNFKKNKVREEK